MSAEAGVSGPGSPEPIAKLQDVRKAYGAVRALDGVTFAIHAGECVGLVGHNGAGKSTLVNLLNGGIGPTEGTVRFGSDDRPGAARRAGVRTVFQELSLCANLTVAENLRVPQHDLSGFGWRSLARRRVSESLGRVFPGHRIDPRATVGDLNLAERQMAEIAIAFADGTPPPRLVILDEPTSSLDAAIAGQLIAYVRRFCAGGGAVIFISHLLGEVLSVASRIVVMKDGRITDERPAGGFTRQGLVDAMGHVAAVSADADWNAPVRTFGPEIVATPDGVRARAGEIVGLAGLAGHGQAEALAALFMDRVSGWSAGAAPAAVFVAGDRVRDGLMPLWSIRRNLSLASLRALSRAGLIERTAEDGLALDWKTRVGIRTDNVANPILSLSGGNQQKVLFARALATEAPLVVMDDPMRGVDVGTKSEVYGMIRDEAEKGRTFLWYSTETEEICLCDRVFVFRNGRISAELTGAEISEERILEASFEMRGVGT
ncbi:MAG: sugar ABC transporter ATP-binding protein [Paracoccaceae bacterium]